MRWASRRIVWRRLVVGVPFVVCALLITNGPSWGRWLIYIGLLWTALVQLVLNDVRRSGVRRGSALTAVTVAWWAGPSSWVWGATYDLSGSVIAATAAAVALAWAATVGWTWAAA